MRIRLYRMPCFAAAVFSARAREIDGHLPLDSDSYPGAIPRKGDIIADPGTSNDAVDGAHTHQLHEVIDSYVVPVETGDQPEQGFEIRVNVHSRTAHEHEKELLDVSAPRNALAR